MAAIHERLQADCLLLGRFPLCHLLLMQDANYPWCILVPDREDIREIYQLSDSDQQQLMQESVQLSRALVAAFGPDKLNVAALGNVVPQLHVHHIVRYRQDVTWPDPVWGRLEPRAYTEERLAEVLTLLADKLPADFDWQIKVAMHGPG
ncbi:MAG: HIT domain-containing protein [Gammaproteobacteria bacterium]|nr:HIT domain-containing protein [Gammaproteobacteria bacterium]